MKGLKYNYRTHMNIFLSIYISPLTLYNDWVGLVFSSIFVCVQYVEAAVVGRDCAGDV